MILIRIHKGGWVFNGNVAEFSIDKYIILFLRLTDDREEWKKDKWDVRILHDKYGVDYNKSKSSYYLDFSKTDEKIREEVKKYFKNGCLVKTNSLGVQHKII